MNKKAVINMLSEYVTENKKEMIAKVLSERTRHLAVVLEDIYHTQNASAVMRTCDCFGIQDLYITQNLHDYIVNPNVVRGASKWVNHMVYERSTESIKKCLNDLKANNYRIVGTTPDTNAASIHDLDVNQKTAIVFGTEKQGISEYVKREADQLVRIPMYGFTESFNISVSAALIMQTLISKLKASNVEWQLPDNEKEELTYQWYKQIVKRSDLLIDIYLRELNSNDVS